MHITIIGTGYVGLVSGVCLADIGHSVVCVDIDTSKIALLNEGCSPIYENGLDDLLAKNREKGRIQFTTDMAIGMKDADIVFFSVDTPMGEYGKANLTNLLAAARTAAQHCSKDHTVFVNKSTAPPGTVSKLKAMIASIIDNKPFSVASNPEFLSEGNAIRDFFFPNRVVIGVEDANATKKLQELYRPIISEKHPLLTTSIQTAELIKYASNSFLALKISFINEIADFCELIGANVKDVARGMGMDERIGHRFLHAGIGYGGSCFGKDVKALVASGEECNFEFKIIKALSTVNDLRYYIVLKKLRKYFSDLKGKRITILGLAFKPMTKDVRDAPSLRIIYELLERGASIIAFDPLAHEEFQKTFKCRGDFSYAHSLLESFRDSDACILLTEWDEFKTIQFNDLLLLMKGRIIIDGRNFFERAEVEKAGFIYEGVGT